MLIKPRVPRFYREFNGVVEACYSVPVKNKKKLMSEGHPGTKEPNITDARELGLLPSVTTILGVLAKPGLERWKLEQAIYSAITLPRAIEPYRMWADRLCDISPGIEGPDSLRHAYENPPQFIESEDAFARRVVQDMDAQAAKAAEFGTRIHDAIANHLDGMHGEEPSRDLEPFLIPFYKWSMDNIEEVHTVEKVVGGKHCGYAGRLDLDCTLKGVGRCIPDIKTQAIKDGKEPVYYREWNAQLSAYSSADTGCARTMSIVINSRTPGPIYTKLWTQDEWMEGCEMFQCCFELWKLMNEYDPENT